VLDAKAADFFLAEILPLAAAPGSSRASTTWATGTSSALPPLPSSTTASEKSFAAWRAAAGMAFRAMATPRVAF
jgi:hypothetical protein